MSMLLTILLLLSIWIKKLRPILSYQNRHLLFEVSKHRHYILLCKLVVVRVDEVQKLNLELVEDVTNLALCLLKLCLTLLFLKMRVIRRNRGTTSASWHWRPILATSMYLLFQLIIFSFNLVKFALKMNLAFLLSGLDLNHGSQFSFKVVLLSQKILNNRRLSILI